MRQISFILGAALCGGLATAQNCDFKDYKAIDGLKAQMTAGAVEITWRGDGDQELRASFTIRDGQPTVHELAARKGQGNWIVLGRDLTPEFEVTSGPKGDQAQGVRIV